MSIGNVRTTTPARPVTRAAAPAQPAAAAAPAPAPKAPVVARGPVATTSKVTGTVVGLAAGGAGAASLSLLWLIGGTAVPVAAYAAMAGIAAVATGIGFLGGDRIGKMLEGQKDGGAKHAVAQVAGGAVGGVLGLTGGFWLGAWALGGLVGTPVIGLATGAAVAVLGALGGAEGAKRLMKAVTGN